jgi:hypothetical protein
MNRTLVNGNIQICRNNKWTIYVVIIFELISAVPFNMDQIFYKVT